MTIDKISRIVYCLIGILYIVIGVGSMLVPAGWIPQRLAGDILTREITTPFTEHLLQEFGTVVLAIGLVFLWYARQQKQSRAFHWMMTFYLALDAVIHWIGPEGLIRPWSRGILNSIPFLVMLLLGLLQLRRSDQQG
jgi:hypothetical protein